MGTVATHSLIAVAALAEIERASAAWASLISKTPFDHLPNAAIRAMPQIYLNIKKSDFVNERARLRGVYRASWSNNAMRFAASLELFIAFQSAGINYRLIKGGAISALVGHWGLRRMGDLDIVIAPESENAAGEILMRLAFTPQVPDGGKPRPKVQGQFSQGPWINKYGAVIDIHSTKSRPQIFTDLFRESGQVIALSGIPLHIPSNELIATISIWHGEKATAATDDLQTLLDLGSILPKLDLSKLKLTLLRSNLLNVGELYILELRHLEVLSTIDISNWESRSVKEQVLISKAQIRNTRNRIARLLGFPKIIRSRRLNRQQKLALRTNSGMRATLFRIWSENGQLRPLERIIHTKLGGFGEFDNKGGPIPERDFRITIPAVKNVPSRLSIRFTFEEEITSSPVRALFINGIAHGLIPLPEDSKGTYEVTPDNNFIEISARCFSNNSTSPVKNYHLSWLLD